MSSFQERPWLIEAIVGLGTPYGLIGGAVAYDFVPELGMAVGGGFTLSGPSVSAAFRVRIPLKRIGLGAEIAWSGGPYEASKCRYYCFDGRDSYRAYAFAHWANAALVIEQRAANGVNLRGFVGGAFPISHGSGHCVPNDLPYGSCPDAESVLMLGIGLGGAMKRD